MPRMAWSVFMTITTLIAIGCSGRCESTLTCDVSTIVTSTLLEIIWQIFRINIFSLSNLGTVFQAICLLHEEHVAMILWSLCNLWPCSPIFTVDSESLISGWALYSIVRSGSINSRATNLIIMAMVVFSSWRCSISCPETTISWRIHLLLQ